MNESPGKLKKIILTVSSLSVLALGHGYAVYYFNKTPDIQYREVLAYKGNIDVRILATGTVSPQNRVDIKPPVAGRVEKIIMDEGKYVKKGQVLAYMSSIERAALIDAARAHGSKELKIWEERYKPIPVLAPVNGLIIVRKVESGQTFSATDVLYTMSDRLIVIAQVDETDIAQIKLNDTAEIVLDAYPEKQVEGHVLVIAFDAHSVNNVTTYDVDVLPEKIPPYMRSGMTANVTFQVESRKNVLLIASEAIKVHDGRYYVLVRKDAKDIPIEKEIEVGLSDGKQTEIVSGLSEGETVLISHLARKLNPGGNPFSPMSPRKRQSPK